jgi:hypothetical protein
MADDELGRVSNTFLQRVVVVPDPLASH